MCDVLARIYVFGGKFELLILQYDQIVIKTGVILFYFETDKRLMYDHTIYYLHTASDAHAKKKKRINMHKDKMIMY